jgi:hypothetical protein
MREAGERRRRRTREERRRWCAEEYQRVSARRMWVKGWEEFALRNGG